MVKDNIREAIKEINERYQTTVILTTHDIEDIEELCHRIIIIDGGKKIYDGNLKDLKATYGTRRKVHMEVKNLKAIEQMNLSMVLKVSEDSYQVELDQDSNTVTVTFDKNKIQVTDVIAEIMRLSEVKDVKIEETALAEIVKEIYNHGV